MFPYFLFLISTVNLFLYHLQVKVQYDQTILQKKQYGDIVYCMTDTLNL